MITWLASYPRSGNTFSRIILSRVFGESTLSVYQHNDGVVNFLGESLVGAGSAEERSLTMEQLQNSSKNWIVKTHNIVTDEHPAIYIVRDGRDSLVSLAHFELRDANNSTLETNEYKQLFEAKLIELMARKSNAGNWGENVNHWLRRIEHSEQPHQLIHYEKLIKDPIKEIEGALLHVAHEYRMRLNTLAPKFTELHEQNKTFFRRGITGSYIDEMPNYIQELFWSKPEMIKAMQSLGYH